MIRRTVYFACCGDYLKQYARTLVDSAHGFDMNVACTVVNADPADVEILRRDGVDVVEELTTDYEQTPMGKEKYLQTIRFYGLSALAARYDEVYVTDVDAIFMRPIDWDIIGRYPVAFKVRIPRKLPNRHMATSEGGLFVRFDGAGLDFIRKLTENLVRMGYRDGHALRMSVCDLPYPVALLPNGYCNIRHITGRGVVHHAGTHETKHLLRKDL